MKFSLAEKQFLLESLCLLSGIPLAESEPTASLWRRTQISASRFQSTKAITKEVNTVFFIKALMMCLPKEWCQCVCLNETQIVLTAIVSVPFNEDPAGSPWIECYSPRPLNFLTAQAGVTISAATEVAPGYSNRVAEQLLDGIYDQNIESCFFCQYGESPYVVFDLGVTKSVRNILLVAQTNDLANRYFRNLTVKVGSAPADGDFSSYEELGILPSGAPYPGFYYNTEAPEAINGKYVSVQAGNVKDAMQICHIEIYVEE